MISLLAAKPRTDTLSFTMSLLCLWGGVRVIWGFLMIFHSFTHGQSFSYRSSWVQKVLFQPDNYSVMHLLSSTTFVSTGSSDSPSLMTWYKPFPCFWLTTTNHLVKLSTNLSLNDLMVQLRPLSFLSLILFFHYPLMYPLPFWHPAQ